VSVDDFFDEERLVQNLAFLLGISSSQIRVVSVVRETISRRRRQDDQGTGQAMERVNVDFEVGNPPAAVITMDTPDMNTMNTTTSDNDTMSDNTTATETPPTGPTLSFQDLEGLTETLVDAIQTGQLTSDLNATVVNAVVSEPEPEPEDPTGGMRATPETGGPQPGDNGTQSLETFSDMQLRMEEEEENETQPIVFTIPTQLSVQRGPSEEGTEGRSLPQQPIIVMFDNLGGIIQNLGLDEAWRVAAVLERGPQGGFLRNSTADLVNGQAEFSGLLFSHPGTYRLSFEVEFPESVEFKVAVEEEVAVLPRDLSLVVAAQPGSGNTSHPLYPWPAVELWEDGALLRDHDWRNNFWSVRATLLRDGESMEKSWEQELTSGYAEFTEISITDEGEYTLEFTVFTDPPSSHLPPPVTSQPFSVAQYPLTRLELTFDADYENIIGENNEYFPQFRAVLVQSLRDTFPSKTVDIYNVTVSRGSILVSLFLTSRSARDLQSYVETLTTSNGTLEFFFRGVELSPATITQDPSYPVEVPEDPEDELTLILVTVLPSGAVLLATLLLILSATLCYRRRRNSQSFKPGSRVASSNGTSMEKEGKYMHHNMGALGADGDVEEFYLISETEKRLEAANSTLSFQSFEMREKGGSTVSKHEPVVTSKVITVPGGSVFINPSTSDHQEEVGRYVTAPTHGKGAATEGSVGGLEREVEEILSKSGSLREAESHLQ
jgi:hypothetical protein